ncbi:ATP-binding cassette domain-containing protein [[Actinomadura] parvosata]|uniref:ATP-binding cassette domain-containing protein n=1 Tax=[Actinomadura] parvosata TaxID=1955412 RepID=UPI00406D0C15
MFFSESDLSDPQTGVVLSGGQWQRLALARALLREDRALMILDEPGSGLDAAAEHDVHTRLREMRKGRTSLPISHRLGAIREDEHIAVLADGVIAEQGTHGDLITADGIYAELFNLQAAGYASGPDLARPSAGAGPVSALPAVACAALVLLGGLWWLFPAGQVEGMEPLLL